MRWLGEFFGISVLVSPGIPHRPHPGGVPGLLAYFLCWLIIPSE
jgi:hypothetical protein